MRLGDKNGLFGPNVFILGSGKCGTTTLYNLLSNHPEVHMSPIKEPSFFCSYFQIVGNPIDYFNLFDSNCRLRGEASHVYFSNPESAPVIRGLFPDARFIVILRDPSVRAYSLYRFMRRHRHEDGEPLEPIDTFLGALKAESARHLSPDFHLRCRQYFWNYLYCGSSMYDLQLERYLQRYGRSRFHVLTLAELVSDFNGTTEGICKFLDIDPGPMRGLFGLKSNADQSEQITYCEACRFLLEQSFSGLTARVDAIVGRTLDWSL